MGNLRRGCVILDELKGVLVTSLLFWKWLIVMYGIILRLTVIIQRSLFTSIGMRYIWIEWKGYKWQSKWTRTSLTMRQHIQYIYSCKWGLSRVGVRKPCSYFCWVKKLFSIDAWLKKSFSKKIWKKIDDSCSWPKLFAI